MRLVKILLAFGVPVVAALALTLHGARDMFAGEIALAFALNLPLIAAPQVAFFAIGTLAHFRTAPVVGGLLALDIWLCSFEWWLFHALNPGGDSTGWLIYWPACIPVLLFGMLLGKATIGLTRRSS